MIADAVEGNDMIEFLFNFFLKGTKWPLCLDCEEWVEMGQYGSQGNWIGDGRIGVGEHAQGNFIRQWEQGYRKWDSFKM